MTFELHYVDVDLPKDPWEKGRSVMNKEYLNNEITQTLLKQELFTPLAYGNNIVYYLRFSIGNARYTYDISTGLYQALIERGCISKKDHLVVYDCETKKINDQSPTKVAIIIVNHETQKQLPFTKDAYMRRFSKLLTLNTKKNLSLPTCMFDYAKCAFAVAKVGRGELMEKTQKATYVVRSIIKRVYKIKK